MKQMLLVVTVAASLAAQGAIAQEQKMYVFGQIGSAAIDFDKSGNDAVLRSAGAANLTSTVNDTAGAVLIGAGYKFTPHASVELGFMKVSDYTYKANFAQGTATDVFSATGVGVNLVGYAPLGETVTAYGKLGVWSFNIDETATVSAGGFGQASQSASSTTPMLGLGVDFKVAHNLSLRVEYDYFNKVGDDKTMGSTKLGFFSGGIAVSF